MPVISRARSEITCRVVYYGPPGAGKTRNLEYIRGELPAEHHAAAAPVEDGDAQPGLLEHLQLELGSIAGFLTRLYLVAAPAASFFAATRKHMLQNADGVVFVSDSRRAAHDENIAALRQLHAELAEQGMDPRRAPLVFQYNKRDLPEGELLTVDELDQGLNFRGAPAFAASAATGAGIFQTLRGVAALVLRHSSET